MSASLFLGRTVDDGQPYRLKAKALRTHGLIVGMTGSGKTGMALVALEELVRSGVPVLAIDPKGDLANLGLVFRGLSEEGFAAWSDGPDGASLSARWREGVEGWGLTPEDATTLADQMAVTLYTPGSEAGIPVDVLGGLQRPDEATLNDAEALRALVSDTISGLLGLTGHEADPVRDPAHIVLSTLLEKAWREGTPVDVATLITQLIDPPFEKVGVFPVDRFFPPDDRMDLAMALNGLIASPSFASWTTGAALDIGAMLEQGDKTRVSIFSIAHLSDDERQFFLSMFLGRVLAWTRTQPGTEQLRAVLFFDEVAGWLPPHPKNPASKRPLLLLMKQARAMGLGVLLATQNPVDVDYKAVSNAGLWCIGKLRTPQDRARLLKGIPGEGLDEKVASLGKREFLMARASGEADVVASRHALCFLRGPFTRTEVKQFQETLGAEPPRPFDAAVPPPFPSADHPPPFPGSASPPPFPGRATPPPFPGAAPAPTWSSVRPPLDLPQWYLDPRVVFSARMNGVFTKGAVARQTDGVTAWAPAIYACFQLRFDEDRAGFVHDERVHRVHFPLERLPTDAGIELPLQPEDLVASAHPGDRYAALPQWMDEDNELKAVRRALIDGIYRTETTGMFVNRALKLKGRGGETREAFDARCRAAAKELCDEKLEKLADVARRKTDKLEDRIERKRAKLMELEDTVQAKRAEEMLNVGETVFSLFSGRRRSLTSAASRRRQTTTATRRVDQAELEIAQLIEEANALHEVLEAEILEVKMAHLEMVADVEEREVRLEKGDIHLEAFGILWVPVSRRV